MPEFLCLFHALLCGFLPAVMEQQFVFPRHSHSTREYNIQRKAFPTWLLVTLCFSGILCNITCIAVVVTAAGLPSLSVLVIYFLVFKTNMSVTLCSSCLNKKCSAGSYKSNLVLHLQQ